MPTPFFSLIFVNYQSLHLLKRSISSWQQSLGAISHEIIVVNNDVNENQGIQELAVPEYIFVKNLGANTGFAVANNEGAKLARGQWLFFLNPDTEYVSGSLEQLQSFLRLSPQSMGGLRLLNQQGKTEPWSAGRFPTLFNILCNNVFGAPKKAAWNQSEFALVDWVSGAALLIEKEFFQSIGGFDEDFFLYFEDVDLARRVAKQDKAVWRSPLVTVLHQGGASQIDRKRQKSFYYASQRTYFEKHRPWIEAQMLAWLQKLIPSHE